MIIGIGDVRDIAPRIITISQGWDKTTLCIQPVFLTSQVAPVNLAERQIVVIEQRLRLEDAIRACYLL